MEATACVKVGGEINYSFIIRVGVREGCVMSPWLFDIFMAGCMREMQAEVGKNRCQTESAAKQGQQLEREIKKKKNSASVAALLKRRK